MSEDDSTILSTEAEDVEAHGRRRPTVMASEEASDETTSKEDDVELHRAKSVMASDEKRDESESEDDVELHGRRGQKPL